MGVLVSEGDLLLGLDQFVFGDNVELFLVGNVEAGQALGLHLNQGSGQVKVLIQKAQSHVDLPHLLDVLRSIFCGVILGEALLQLGQGQKLKLCLCQRRQLSQGNDLIGDPGQGGFIDFLAGKDPGVGRSGPGRGKRRGEGKGTAGVSGGRAGEAMATWTAGAVCWRESHTTNHPPTPSSQATARARAAMMAHCFLVISTLFSEGLAVP